MLRLCVMEKHRQRDARSVSEREGYETVSAPVKTGKELRMKESYWKNLAGHLDSLDFAN